MLLIKHLLDKGFDVHVFLLPYYTSEKNVDNFFIIEVSVICLIVL